MKRREEGDTERKEERERKKKQRQWDCTVTKMDDLAHNLAIIPFILRLSRGFDYQSQRGTCTLRAVPGKRTEGGAREGGDGGEGGGGGGV